jgi:hypothetical protein
VTPVNQDALSEARNTAAAATSSGVPSRPRGTAACSCCLLDYVRHRVRASENLTGLTVEVRKLATDALELLEQGLRDYAAKPADATAGALIRPVRFPSRVR